MSRCFTSAVLIASLVICTCGGSGGTEPAARIVGSWESDDGRVSTFKANGDFEQVYQGNTYFSHWEAISSDTLRFTGRSSTNQYAQQDSSYVGYCPFTFDAEGNLILDGKACVRREQ